MDILYAIPLLVALIVGLFVVRRALQRSALRRRKAVRARRGHRQTPRSFTPLGTKRSQMRTDDDPTTVMERITESKPTQGSRRKH